MVKEVSIVLEELVENVMHVYSSATSTMEQGLASPIAAIAQVVHDPFLRITIPTNVEKQIATMVAKVEVVV